MRSKQLDSSGKKAFHPVFSLGLFAAVLLGVGYVPAGWSQTSSDDELLRQQERERQLRQQQETTPDIRIPRSEFPSLSPGPAQETPCFVISRIILEGERADLFRFGLQEVTEGEFSLLGRCLGTQGINAALANIQNAIVARGYVTSRVLATPQDLSGGELKLTVIPGKVREIRFAGELRGEGAQENALPLKSGDILNLRDIEQALENLKRSPSSDADIQIAPANAEGAAPGESDLLIKYKQGFPLRLTLTADDGGSKFTGKYQGSATLSVDNPLGINDLFYVSANRDLGGGETGERATRGHSAHYSFPLGYWLIGANYSRHRYHQAVAGLNQTYIYGGISQTQDIKLTRLMYRDANRKTSASLRGFLRSSQNFIDDTEIEVQRRRTAGWEAAVTHRHFIGQSVVDSNLAFRRGTGALDALHAPEEALGEGTSRMKVLNLDLNLQAPFDWSAPWGRQRVRYAANLRGQRNYTPLTPQDRFSIGSRYTVRGFDGELMLSAERGWLIRNDLGLSMGQSGQEIYLGLDYGRVGGRTADLLPGTGLSGAVVGWRGQIGQVNYDFFTGTPMHKPDGFRTSKRVAGFNLLWSY